MNRAEVLTLWRELTKGHTPKSTFILPEQIVVGDYTIPADTEVKIWQRIVKSYTGPLPRLGTFFLADAQVSIFLDGTIRRTSAPRSDQRNSDGYTVTPWQDIGFGNRSGRRSNDH